MKWLLPLVVMGGLAAAEPPIEPIDQGTDWKAIIKQVEAEVEVLKQTEDLAPALEAVGRQAAGISLPPAGIGADSIRAELAGMQAETLGTDVIQDVITTKLVPGGNLDPTAGMTYDVGEQGLLWAFWAIDAPGMEDLPNQLAQAQSSAPGLRIHDLHVMRLTDWQDLLHTLGKLKDRLEHDDPLIDNETEIRRKRDLTALTMPRYYAATQMAQTRRYGGMLLVEDMTAALAWSVRSLPSFVYVSPRGVVHRLRGVSQDRPLAAWMQHCQAWESEHDQIIRDRLKAGP